MCAVFDAIIRNVDDVAYKLILFYLTEIGSFLYVIEQIRVFFKLVKCFNNTFTAVKYSVSLKLAVHTEITRPKQ